MTTETIPTLYKKNFHRWFSKFFMDNIQLKPILV